MLNITQINVNDRNSIRTGNVMGILSSDLLGSLLLQLRCLTHQVCFAFTHGIGHPSGGGFGLKRYAYEPVQMSRPAAPRTWQRRSARSTARGARSAG